MNKEIEELRKDICICNGGRKNYYECGDCFGEKDKCFGCSGIAEKLYNAGYHKTVWHKVADGDLPKEDTEYWCYLNVQGLYMYNILKFNNSFGFYTYDLKSGFVPVKDEVIAWTELPEYKE